MIPNTIQAIETGMIERPNLAPPLGLRFMRFGPFLIDQQRQEVTKNGLRLKLQGKVYQVLVALLERPGEVVSREELRQRLWPADTHVNYDANVNTTVNKLRQALGDSTEKPLYIETIPRKGYCLLMQSEGSEASTVLLAPSAIPDTAPLPAAPSLMSDPLPPRSGFWVPIGVAGLILAGMLLGAGITITTLMISHFAQIAPWP